IVSRVVSSRGPGCWSNTVKAPRGSPEPEVSGNARLSETPESRICPRDGKFEAAPSREEEAASAVTGGAPGLGWRVPGGRLGNPASASIWNRGPERTKIATPLEGHKLTKVSATICRVDGSARWLIMAERISCAWLGLPGNSPGDQPTGPRFLRAGSAIVCSTE